MSEVPLGDVLYTWHEAPRNGFLLANLMSRVITNQTDLFTKYRIIHCKLQLPRPVEEVVASTADLQADSIINSNDGTRLCSSSVPCVLNTITINCLSFPMVGV